MDTKRVPVRDIYTYEQVMSACLEFFNGDELAASNVVNKYLLRDNKGRFLERSPNDYLRGRLPAEFCRIESRYPNPLSREEIEEELAGFKKVCCQGSPTYGIGNPFQIVSLANCFFVGQPEDSYGGICARDEELAQVMKRRGGAGIDISSIRPSGMTVQNSARTSDGIRSFATRYSNTTKEVAQEGRRGALLISLDGRHPDVETFIDLKRVKGSISGANISVKWHDDFMTAVEKNQDYVLRFPVDLSADGAPSSRAVKARDIWKRFISANWGEGGKGGEPGCLFWDRITGQSISDCYAAQGFRTGGTNPCGELPLSERGSCILMFLNLTGYVLDLFGKDPKFDWNAFKRSCRVAARLVDDLVDLEAEKIQQILDKVRSDPEPEETKRREILLWEDVLEKNKQGRRTGLGVSGLADAMAMLNIKYDSEQAIEFAKTLFSAFQANVYEASAELAGERGPFPLWDWEKEKDSHYIGILPKVVREKIHKLGRRNIASLTIAPAGTMSTITQTSSGIEPVFKLVYTRNRKMTTEEEARGVKPTKVDDDGIKWISFDIVHHGLKLWMEKTGIKQYKKSPYWGCSAFDLDWHFRIRLQGLINRYIDHSISSTINCAEETTQEQVSEMYMLAWKEGCKGLTVFREGSREAVLFAKGADVPEIVPSRAPTRPETLPCEIHYSNITTRDQKRTDQWIFFVGLLKGEVYEIFGGLKERVEIPRKFKAGWLVKSNQKREGKSLYHLYLGSLEDTDERLIVHDIATTFAADPGSYTRMISLQLRHGVPISRICEQLLKDSEAKLFTFEKGISRVLRKYITEGEKSERLCPRCSNQTLEYKSGCVYCITPGCGWSACD